MAYRFTLSYANVTPDHAEKIESFMEASGDSFQQLANQYTRGELGRNRSQYVELARFDFSRRGMDVGEWANIVVEEGMKGLPPYIQSFQPDEIPVLPVAHIFLPTDVELVQRSLNYIELTRQNLILLKVAIHYDGGNIVKFLSKVIYKHLRLNWDELYAPQITAETSNSWLLK